MFTTKRPGSLSHGEAAETLRTALEPSHPDNAADGIVEGLAASSVLAAADAPVPAPPAPKLESLCNKVTEVASVLAPCTCRARTCDRCGRRIGWEVRQVLLERADFWQRPGMFTLTVDRSRFASPEAAHAAITDGKFIARLMRRLGVARWMWTLEFQTKTGDGWPHWHLLVDLASCPGGRLDLKLAWHLWRDLWKLGGLQLKVKETKAADARHAVFYITKYLTKPPRGGFPIWVLERHSLRFVQGCKALGPIVSKPRTAPDPTSPPRRRRRYLGRRSLLDRTAGCEQHTHVFDVDIDTDTGAIRHAYRGTIKASLELLEVASLNEDMGQGQVNRAEVLGKECRVLVGADAGLVEAHLERRPRYAVRAFEAVAARREAILARNVFAARRSAALEVSEVNESSVNVSTTGATK